MFAIASPVAGGGVAAIVAAATTTVAVQLGVAIAVEVVVSCS